MHKYLAVITYKFQQSLQFRTELLVWIVLDLVPFGVTFLVLRSMYQGNWILHTYTSVDMIQYYFFVIIIQALTSTHFESWRVEEIKNGKIDAYLLRPFSYLNEIIFSDIAKRLFYFCLFIPLYVAFFFIVQSISPFELPNVNLPMVWLFLMLLLFAYTVELCFGLLIVLLGFWFEGSQGLEHFKWILITLFSGSMVPIEFLPQWLQTIAQFLPFQYMYAVPINLIQSRYIFGTRDILVVTVTAFSLIGLVFITLRRAIYKYSSSGG